MEEGTSLFPIEEMSSPFDQIKETDKNGKDWWNSRKLAKLIGYVKYWNFEKLMQKVASFLQQEKGLDLKEHMVDIEEMAKLGNGTVRKVTSVMLSKTARMIIAMNGDQRKPVVKAAKEYFGKNVSSAELATSLEGNNHVLPIQTLLQFTNNSPSFSGGKRTLYFQ